METTVRASSSVDALNKGLAEVNSDSPSTKMVKQLVSVVQVKPIPTGTPEYEARREELRRALHDKIPTEYLLPESVFANPPKNVSTIPRTCGILTQEELTITEDFDAVGLAQAIASSQFSAVAVATAFCKRAIIAHQLTCCLTQWFMKQAIEQARQLDEYVATHGKTIGPLHGVPISIKEHMPMAGTYSSYGYLATLQYDEKDSQMVQILRDLGAVFYVKTNQPQGIMHLESDGFYGRVLNPFNINLSAGGSTGGEAALIALKGSVLGVGTDIGGSVRGPSAFCGIYGFKATAETLPTRNFLPETVPAEMNILASTGPMCRSLRDMDFFVTNVLATQPYLTDPSLVPIPWIGLSTPTPKLRIGIMEDDGYILPQPPVRKALAWAKALLSDPKYSHLIEMKTFKPYEAARAWKNIRQMYYPDGAINCKKALESAGEPMHPLTAWIYKEGETLGELTATQVTAQRTEREAFRRAFAESWTDQGVDVVLGPAFVGPASAHDTARYWTYTALWNFVDYPGAVFPTPVQVEATDVYAADYVPLSEDCAQVKRLWEKTDFAGAPINLQLTARRFHDNYLFGALAVLQGVLELP